VPTLKKKLRTASLYSATSKENTPCISDLAGVKFLLKKERVFFRGSDLQVFGQCGGAKYNADEAKQKLFLREEKNFSLP